MPGRFVGGAAGRWAVWCTALLLAPACFDATDELRGKPCTADASCGTLSCEYGVCGGPQRCESGAGVGDYCFALTEQEFAVGDRPSALGVGLVDPDPNPDLVVGNAGNGTLSVLLNDGEGSFGSITESGPIGAVLRELVIGHVDKGGLADVVAITESDALVVVPLLREGGGPPTFGAMATAASGLVSPSRPRVGDFVDDPLGAPDVAALVQEGLDVRRQDQPLVFSGDLVTSVAGASDIRLIGQGMERAYIAKPDDHAVVSHSRNPTGIFSARKTIDVGGAPEHIVLEDLDLDDYADLLTVSATGQLWLTRGKDAGLDGWHMPAQVYDVGWTPFHLAAANLDDDLDLELVIAGGPEGGRRDVYLFDNDGDGKPIYGGSLGLADTAAVALADLEPDGVPELVVVDTERGTVRIARRTVAPPPPGGEESSGGTTGVTSMTSDPTVDPSEPTTPSETNDPTIETEDPTFPMETGDPDCPTNFWIGSVCFTYYDQYSTGIGIAHLEIGDVDTDGYEDLVVVDALDQLIFFIGTQSTSLATYAPSGMPPWIAPAPATGLTTGVLDWNTSYRPYAIVTHGAGISAVPFVDPAAMADAATVVDSFFGPTSHPRIVSAFPSEKPQVAFETDGALGFIEGLLDDSPPVIGESAGVTDFDEAFIYEQLTFLPVAATLAGATPYLFSPGEVAAEPPIGGIPAITNIAASFEGWFVTTDGIDLYLTLPDETMSSVVLYSGSDLGDIEIGDFDGDGYEDFVVQVAVGGKAGQLLAWVQLPGTGFDGPYYIPTPGLTGVAVRRTFGELGPTPSELLVADNSGNITHLVASYLVQ